MNSLRGFSLKKAVSSITAAAFALALFSGCSTESIPMRTLDDIRTSGYINIGIYVDKPPFGYVDENGKNSGYDVMLAERIASDLGLDAKFTTVNIGERITSLEDHTCDMVIANFSITPERSNRVDFSLPYMKTALGMVSPDEKVVTDLEALTESDPVIVLKGTTGESFLNKFYPNLKLISYGSREDAAEAMRSMTAAGLVNDNTDVIQFANENTGFTVGIPEFGEESMIAPAVAKGNSELLNWLDSEMAALGSEGFFHAAYDATLADTFGADFADTIVVESGQ